jgi:hypothetical protein
MAYGAGPAAGPVQPNEVIILNIYTFSFISNLFPIILL